MKSLKTRLVWMVVALVFTGWIITAVITYIHATHIMVQEADRQLKTFLNLSHNIVSSVYLKSDQGIAEYIQERLESQDELLRLKESYLETEGVPSVNIWLEKARVVLSSDAPAFPEPGDDLAIFYRSPADNSLWRVVYSYNEKTNVWVLGPRAG